MLHDQRPYGSDRGKTSRPVASPRTKAATTNDPSAPFVEPNSAITEGTTGAKKPEESPVRKVLMLTSPMSRQRIQNGQFKGSAGSEAESQETS